MTGAVKEMPPKGTAILSGGLDSEHHPYSTTPANSVNRGVEVYEGNKIIGQIDGRTFVKKVKGSKHQLRKPPAWAISKQAFCGEILPNTENIIVWDSETGTRYEVATSTFADQAFEIERGFEPQLALELRHWHTQGCTEQLSLWGGEM